MKRIYLIESNDKDTIIDSENVVYKIGVTSQDYNKRVKQLSTGNHKTLNVIKEFNSEYAFKIESRLHQYFSHKRIDKEWFKLTSEDINNFEDLCRKYENVFIILKEHNNPFVKF